MIRNRTTQFTRLRDEKGGKSHGEPTGTNGYNYVSAHNLLEDKQGDDSKSHIVNVPPDWLARVSDVQYDLAKIKTKSTWKLG